MNLLPNYPKGFSNIANIAFQEYIRAIQIGEIEDGTVPDNANVSRWVIHAIESFLASTSLNEEQTLILSRLRTYYNCDINGDYQGMYSTLNLSDEVDSTAFTMALHSLQLEVSNILFAVCNIMPSNLDTIRLDASSVFAFIQAFRGSFMKQFGTATNDFEMVDVGNNSINIARNVIESINKRVPDQTDIAVLNNSFGFFFGNIVGAIRNEAFISALGENIHVVQPRD